MSGRLRWVVVLSALALVAQGRLEGADEAPLRIAPRSENSSVDLWNTQVGSQGWLKFELPENLADYREAILLLRVDDIDAPEEADLVVNEKLKATWAKSMIGEGEHGGAIPLPIDGLRPGRNYFQFTFASNLNNTTAGCAIREAELDLFKALSAERKERIQLEAASWGRPVDWTRAQVREGPPAKGEAAPDAKPAVTDYLEDNPLARWEAAGGDWDATCDIDIYDLEERDIYRSPEEPSHLAWVGLWKEPGGDVKTCFAQITGNLGLETSYRPWYGRGKSHDAWKQFCREHKMRLGPEDAASTTKAEYPTLVSRDNGDSWENLGSDQKPRGANLRFLYAADGSIVNNGVANLRCRDGRIVSTAWPSEWIHDGKPVYGQYIAAIRESMDDGKTWTATQWIAPPGTEADLLKETGEESAMVELADGRILMVIRCDPGRTCETYLTRVGPGKYEATPPVRLPLPHSGLPELVRGSDGVIWNWQIDGHWYTEDDGKTWHPTAFRFWSYYGKMIEAAPNQVLCVTQYLVHDSPYPYWYDGSIRMYRFSWRRAGTLEQKDDAVPFALSRRREGEFADAHLRADVRADGVSGLAFRVQPDGRSFYGLAVVLPGSPAYARWFVPDVQQEVLAANYTAGDTMTVAAGEPMLVIARIENGKVTVLRGTRLSYVPRGSWVRLQVKVEGDLIQGAVNSDPPTYVGARDATLSSGGVGFFTDTSAGAFRRLDVWPSARMIRDLWR
ncbi:MAG: sialidase family protein [Planctomycetota bacterium]